MIAIKAALDAAQFTIPFPIRTLDFGADVVGGQGLERTGVMLRSVTAPKRSGDA